MASLPTDFKFDNTLGAMLIGGLACAVLYGTTFLQAFIYFQRYTNDRLPLKLLVAFLWGLDTFDFILTCHILYWYLISNYTNPLAIFHPVWSLLVHVAVTSVSDFLVRTMFAQRVYKLSQGNWMLTAIIIAISLVDLTVGILITIRAFSIKTFPGLVAIQTEFYLNFAAGVSGDIVVALSLCYFLYKSRTGFTRTDTLISRLVAYSVNTGLITALDATAGFITYATMPNNFVFIAFYLCLSKLYVNSYLASLNARESMRSQLHSDNMVSIHLSGLSQPPSWPRMRVPGVSAGETETYEARAFASQASTDGSTLQAAAGLSGVKIDTSVERVEDYIRARPRSHEKSPSSPSTPSFVAVGEAV